MYHFIEQNRKVINFMDKKVLFNETLTSLVEYAVSKGNKITQEDVHIYFKDLIEDENQYPFIYEYLASNKIEVEGIVQKTSGQSDDLEDAPEISADSIESQEELQFIEMYMKDIDSIAPLTDDERDELVSRLLADDLDVVNRLVEGHLATVASIADSYRGKGVHFGDLIQEGNMGLMLGISDFSSNAGNFLDFITRRIHSVLEETVNTQLHSDRVGQHLANKLNHLDDTTQHLSEKLGRAPEISELADAMGLPEDEVSMLLKTSLDILSVNEDTMISPDDTASPSSEGNAASDPLEWKIPKK